MTVGFRRGDSGALTYVEGTELLISPGPLTLEFFFDQPMAPDSLWQVMGAGYQAIRIPVPGKTHCEWLTDRHARCGLPQVPRRLDLALGDFRAITGLLPAPRSLVVRNNDPEPYLERVNLTAGTRVRVMTLPAEIIEAHLSPDGKRIATLSWERRVDRSDNWWPSAVTVADPSARTLTRVEMDGHQVRWQDSNTLINIGTGLWGREEGWQSWDAAVGGKPADHNGLLFPCSVSPDGRVAAWLDRRKAMAGGDEGRLPAHLVVLNLETGEHQVVEDFISDWWIAKGGDFTQWVAWSPGGQAIAALDPVERYGRSDLVIYDRKTGTRRVVLAAVNVGPWGYRLAWSPDGTKLLATSDGHLAKVIPLDGTPQIQLPEWGTNLAFWDGTGQRILSATAQWAGVYVFDVTTRTRTDLGDGLPVGWDGDAVYIIRWGTSDQRYWSSGP
ncbi:MAG TPA: hypothetical protein VGK74_15250 [Symbiobacteriaceae bacterium]